MTRTLRSFRFDALRLAAVAGASLLAAASAHAQWGGYPVNNGRNDARLVLEWQGNVDREVEIRVGRDGATAQGTQGRESRGRFVSRGNLPSGGGTLYVQRVDGRGNVDIVQQPGTNGYGDGVIRIRDSQGGADYYDVRVYWQPNGTYSNNGEVYGHDRYPANDGRGRNDSYGHTDRNGVALDRNGHQVRDRSGNLVYERHGNRVVARDRNGNVIFDRNGHAVYEKARNGRRR